MQVNRNPRLLTDITTVTSISVMRKGIVHKVAFKGDQTVKVAATHQASSRGCRRLNCCLNVFVTASAVLFSGTQSEVKWRDGSSRISHKCEMKQCKFQK
jgi:hypothetical protein